MFTVMFLSQMSTAVEFMQGKQRVILSIIMKGEDFSYLFVGKYPLDVEKGSSIN